MSWFDKQIPDGYSEIAVPGRQRTVYDENGQPVGAGAGQPTSGTYAVGPG